MTGQDSDEQREHARSLVTRREPSVPVTTIATHISILAFQGERVYKLKKAQRFPFIDLSTAELRLADCEREVALNRRLAPDVYLDIEAVSDADGEVVDHVVVMRQMPEDPRISSLVQGGDPVRADLTRLTRTWSKISQMHDATANVMGRGPQTIDDRRQRRDRPVGT